MTGYEEATRRAIMVGRGAEPDTQVWVNPDGRVMAQVMIDDKFGEPFVIRTRQEAVDRRWDEGEIDKLLNDLSVTAVGTNGELVAFEVL